MSLAVVNTSMGNYSVVWRERSSMPINVVTSGNNNSNLTHLNNFENLRPEFQKESAQVVFNLPRSVRSINNQSARIVDTKCFTELKKIPNQIDPLQKKYNEIIRDLRENNPQFKGRSIKQIKEEVKKQSENSEYKENINSIAKRVEQLIEEKRVLNRNLRRVVEVCKQPGDKVNPKRLRHATNHLEKLKEAFDEDIENMSVKKIKQCTDQYNRLAKDFNNLDLKMTNGTTVKDLKKIKLGASYLQHNEQVIDENNTVLEGLNVYMKKYVVKPFLDKIEDATNCVIEHSKKLFTSPTS